MEDYKYKVIKSLVEKGKDGNKKNAASKLNITVRQVDRLISKYKEYGRAGFSHGNKGKSPSKKIDDQIKEKIINIYISDYLDANITHFSEIIEADYQLNISKETIRLWPIDRNIISPKLIELARKELRRNSKKSLNYQNLIKKLIG